MFLGIYSAYLSKVSTVTNMTETIINPSKAYNTRCKGILIDPLYGQVIVAQEVQTGLDDGCTLDIGPNFACPVPATTNWNVIVHAYTPDCLYLL